MASHNFDKQHYYETELDGDCHWHTTICNSLAENYCALNPRVMKTAFISNRHCPNVSHHGNQRNKRQRAGGTEAKETEIDDILPFPLYNK